MLAKYTNDLKSRKKEGAKEIHIATRWSVHDVIGRLENQYGGDSRAKFIVLFRHWTQTVKVISITPTVSDSAAAISRI